MSFRVNYFQIESRDRRSATDDLHCAVNLRDFGNGAGMAECKSTLVDSDNVAPVKCDRQGVFCEPVCDVEAFELESVGLERFQEAIVGIGTCSELRSQASRFSFESRPARKQ
jgi:hypothetical protein